MSKLLPASLLLGGVALLAFALTLPTPQTHQVAAIGTTSTPSVSFLQEEVQTREGSTIYLKVKLDQPVTRTTKVTIRFNPEAGTTSRDIPGLSSTKVVSFYQGGLTVKTIAIPTSRTAAQADKAFTATITKVDNTAVQGDTARVIVKDQRSTAPLVTIPSNNTNTTTNIITPTNCAQYAGVIPGETRKASVIQRSFKPMVLNPVYGFSAAAQQDLVSMQDDIGLRAYAMGPSSSWNTISIPSGTVLSYKIKTSDYNYPTWQQFEFSDKPLTPTGTIAVSISQCPGDLTSTEWIPKNCSGIGSQVSTRLDFGVLQTGQYACNLDLNKTYYLNISSGFADGRDKGRSVPHIGTFDGTNAGTEMVVDAIFWGRVQGPSQSGNTMYDNLIKNKSAYYAEVRRAQGEASVAAQKRVADCRALVAAANPRTGRECSALPMPASLILQ